MKDCLEVFWYVGIVYQLLTDAFRNKPVFGLKEGLPRGLQS